MINAAPNRFYQRIKSNFLIISLACGVLMTLSTACTTYKIEIQQGNFISKEMAAQLKVGMSREQVRAILGTPLLMSSFHSNRWDYIYYLNPNTSNIRKVQFTVYFEDNKLIKFEGDELPSEPRSGLYIEPTTQTESTPENNKPNEQPEQNTPKKTNE